MNAMERLLNYLQAVDIGDCLAAMLILSVPTTLCLLLWFRASCVATWRRLSLTIIVLVLAGWGVVFFGCFVATSAENGFSHVCALFLGWAYPWILGFPILLLTLVFWGIDALGRRLRRKVAVREESLERPPRWLLISFVFAVIVYSVFLSVKPAAVWRDWGDRQYRTVVTGDKIVHVQIREANQVYDVESCATYYHRYDVEPASDDTLLFRSSDIGDQYLRKTNGIWQWQLK